MAENVSVLADASWCEKQFTAPDPKGCFWQEHKSTLIT